MEKNKIESAWCNPNLGLLVKLGSAIVHGDEYLSPGGHAFDLEEFQDLLRDQEVRAWLLEGTKLALLPLKREPK